jgi:thiosulfate/3-mercaptopyruvate sulfurtransferase
MRLQSDLSCPLPAEGERPSTIGGRTAIAGAIPVLLFILFLSLILLAGSASAGTETGEFCPTCPDWTKLVGAIESPNSISPDEVILDISPSAVAYIEGAVNLNYDLFFSEGGEIVPASEMAQLLGDAGISSNDSLLIAGECLPCGGGPSPAFFTYWALKYLGHEKVRVLDGTIEDWKAAGLKISNISATRPKAEYIPHIRPELLATYEYVVTGGAQIVDARPANAYELGSIPGAINMPYENVLVNDSMMPKEMLNEHFLDLDKNRSVVVYTNIGVEAALLWFALNESGYDARLYTWRDWLENQPKFPYELAEVSAQPNPVRSGEATTITASFIERVERENSTQDSSSTVNSSANQELKLTVKGCATCGFGSPQGFANLDRKDGYVQIGSNRKAGQSSDPTTNTSEQSSKDGTLRCTAVIYGPDGDEVTRTSLLETSRGRYMGIWNADVAPGVYKVSIVASLDGNAEAFTDVLQVEVTRKG